LSARTEGAVKSDNWFTDTPRVQPSITVAN